MHTRLACPYKLLALGVLLACTRPLSAQNHDTLSVAYAPRPAFFPLVAQSRPAAIDVEPGTAKVVSIAANALQQDLKEITGAAAVTGSRLPDTDAPAVIIGTLGNKGWIDALARQGKINTASIVGQWESYCISVVGSPFPHVSRALVIAGSDPRGTAFGVFELSRRIGVSPFTWWADVHPAPHSDIYLSPGSLLQGPPAVKYRGIFLNDEDWGLQPWAAHKMDPAVKDIGPHTYARIFELLLRLRANYIWPAMHPCTKAFYYYPGNPRLANDYAIVVGSSHCEPMLRNNVFEWAENYTHEYGSAPGEWRYDHNKTQIYNYWKDRLQQSSHYESVYTVGMRGIHDGSMPGPKSLPEKVKLLQEVIDDQRSLLHNGLGKPLTDIPQIFCPYKEVLNIYRNGLSLPDDVTIVWADDNHGYIRQLSSPQEQQRSGRSGVYYHLSYWGSPQDYLWLSSVSPYLISYEMSKAYHYGADRVWIFNVGDIKPAEMDIEFSMDLAWNVQQWPPTRVTSYIRDWAARTFGDAYASSIAHIEEEYYQLAQAGKPEHMNSVRLTDAEADARLARYEAITLSAIDLYHHIPDRLKDAYFELVFYPVAGAFSMNEKILYAQKSLRLAAAGNDSAFVCADFAKRGYDAIQLLTARYNDSIAHGKWAGIMSSHPRNQPVFDMPPVATQQMVDSARRAGRSPSPGGTPAPLIQTIPAVTYVAQKANAPIQVIEGLGAGGNGVTLFPFAPVGNSDTALADAPWLEYRARLEAGAHTLLLKCLPTQGADGKDLRYAISINNEPPQIVNINTEAESRAWKENVLRGYALGKSTHTVGTTGTANIRIWFPDPGLVINQLLIE